MKKEYKKTKNKISLFIIAFIIGFIFSILFDYSLSRVEKFIAISNGEYPSENVFEFFQL